MKKLYLTLLWHQHQPYYKDDGDGRFHMPWAYLHALKDYYEMAAHVEKAPGVKAVFNFVPSLLIQLEEYANPEVQDNFLILLRKPVSSLTPEERRQTANQCFMANTNNMIRPLKRFSDLYDKLVSKDGDTGVFDNGELLDLEVLYLLAWTGRFMREEDPLVADLLKKGSRFTEEDKLEFLKRGAQWTAKIVDIHKRLQATGKAEIACTPYFHPILPLLTEIDCATEACPDMMMPSLAENFESDADWHLKEGLAEFERVFGFRPAGMWPAEGSVSQKTVEKYAREGVRWIATDEEVLANSLKIDLKEGANRKLLYKKRFQNVDGKKINIFFRDKTLSDLIGFSYSGWNEDDAVRDFTGHLKKIYDSCDFSPHVAVILDGENAWEYYKDNASGFFTKLYGTLGNLDWLETATFSETASNPDIPEEMLGRITAGSWIMGNFKIWIGHPEKNKAWELLGKTKRTVDKHISEADLKTAEQIYKELHAAEGSDWFWWFGDDHFSIQADVFDKLFRTHLVNIHRLLKLNVPAELFQPIKASSKTGFLRKPTSFVTPEIDGRFTNFYEWLSSGEFDLKSDAGSMHSGGSELQKLLYGFDKENLYLALNSDFSALKGISCEIEILSGSDRRVFEIDLENPSTSKGDVKAAVGKILEAAIPLDVLKGAEDGRIYLVFRLKKDGSVIEKAPLYNAVEINIADDFKNEWIV